MSARGSSKRGGLEASRGAACVRLRLGGLRRQAKDPAPCPQSSGRQAAAGHLTPVLNAAQPRGAL